LSDSAEHFLSQELRWREDTAGVLIELLQEYMVNTLQRATAICCELWPSNEYPKLTAKHLEFQAKLYGVAWNPDLGSEFDLSGCLLHLLPEQRLFHHGMVHIAELTRDTIVRKLAYRAGVVKMSNLVYEKIWLGASRVLSLLLAPVIMEIYACEGDLPFAEDFCPHARRVLTLLSDMQRIPPVAAPVLTYDRGPDLTPVPAQVERSAKGLSLSDKVYELWLVEEGSTEEEERATALEAYDVAEADEEVFDLVEDGDCRFRLALNAWEGGNLASDADSDWEEDESSEGSASSEWEDSHGHDMETGDQGGYRSNAEEDYDFS
jgi:hypothetical protein